MIDLLAWAIFVFPALATLVLVIELAAAQPGASPLGGSGSPRTAIIVPAAGATGYAEDELNQLMVAKVSSGQPLRYYIGAGWTRGGEFASRQDWQKYVAAEAARARSPIKVALSGGQ